METYERNKENKPELGQTFERNVAIYTMLTLQNCDQAIAFEFKNAPSKFDDIVLRVGNNGNYVYHYRQLKHRDTTHDPDAYLTWNELLTRTKSKFGIPFYYDFLGQQNKSANCKANKSAALRKVKELAFVTNYNLVQGPGTANNLEDLAKNLLNQPVTNKTPKHFITEGDLKEYFEECSDDPLVWTPPSSNQKSYKFTDKAVKAIFNGTKDGFKNPNDFDSFEYDTFLLLLVFRVSMPHVNELKLINQQLMTAFLPFYKNQIRDRHEHTEDEFIQLFKPLQNSGAANTSGQGTGVTAGNSQQQFAAWATVEKCQLVFQKLTSSFKETVHIGSRENYELGVLTPKHDQLFSGQNTSPPSWINIFNEVSSDLVTSSPRQIVNLFSDHSNATVLTLNTLSFLRKSSDHAWRTLVVQVVEKNGIERVVEYFKLVEKEILGYKQNFRMSFYIFIEISPFFLPADKANEHAVNMIQDLTALLEVRKFIKFVVVTQSPIFADGQSLDLESVEGSPLKWGDLSEMGKEYLLGKTLYLNHKRQTSLKMLGFERETRTRDEEGTAVEWLHSRALAELIIHEQEKPLSLGLPMKEPDMETDYIEREIQLPLVRKITESEISKKLAYREEDYDDEKYYLLTLANSKRYNDVYLWTKSKADRNISELKNYIVISGESDVTVSESKLLEENVNFGTGSRDNKLIVIIDQPGKGKTWLLNSLSNRFLDDWSDQLPHHPLLLRVNLREIKDWHIKSTFLEFLLSHSLNFEGNETKGDDLDIAIVKRKCLNSSEPSVFVLIDGYDEINDEQRKTTLNLIDRLKNDVRGVKRIILTSRPEGSLENELESRFRQLSLHLKNFSKDEQIYYLRKRWGTELEKQTVDKKISDCTKEGVKVFAEQLVHLAGESLKDEHSTVLEIPLQCWIFSVCFFEELERYVNQGTDSSSRPKIDEASFELLSLYDRFFNVKIDVLLQQKADLLEKNDLFTYVKTEMKKSFLNALLRISTVYMVKEIDDAQVIGSMNWDVYRSEIKCNGDETNERNYSNDLKRAIKLGFVRSSVDEKQLSGLPPQDVRFLHRTFAEYFFAFALIRNFISTKSELLDVVPREGTFDKSFELITKRILVAEEYAGVRRFLRRMLKKHVPSEGERCPFASEKRSDVLERWPAIGHQHFNKHLAELAISQVSIFFKDWSREETKSLSINEILEQDFSILKMMKPKPEEELIGILHGHSDEPPSVTLLALHCIKEYACRPGTSNTDREKLAYYFTLASFTWYKKGYSSNEIRKKLFASMLRLFDRALGFSSEANDVFSEWFFNLVLALIGDSSYEESGLEIIALTCEIIKDHRYASNIKNYVQTVVSLMFKGANGKWINGKADQFFEISSSSIFVRRAFPGSKGESFQRILVSLSDTTLLPEFLFTELANWFAVKLRNYTKSISEHLLSPYRSQNSCTSIKFKRPEDYQMEFEGHLSEVISKWFVHPIAFAETVKFLENNASKLTNIIGKLCNITFIYIHETLQLINVMMQQYEIRLLHSLRRPNRFKVLDHNRARFTAMVTICWYYPLTGKITSYLPDNQRTREMNAFLTDIGRKLLAAYAQSCCCTVSSAILIEFGILYPFASESEMSRESFRTWTSNKLKEVWEAKGEIELINFLFEYREIAQENVLPSGTRSEGPEHEIDPYLIAIDLAKMPCLLFSDMVRKYIPERLSQDGLRHLEETLKKMRLFQRDSSSFRGLRFVIKPEDSKFMWDALMQEDATKIFICNPERVKATQEKLRQMSLPQDN